MNRFETAKDLPAMVRPAVVDLLFRMADDELIIGHRNSEWTGHAPILEEDIAFSSMAQDEMGHARAYYEMLHELGEADPDTLAFGRKPRQYRCASLVSLPKGDWAFSVVRQFLYDTSESVRLAALSESTFVPLAQLARKLRGEEKYHLMHGRSWVARLGSATEESRKRMQTALATCYPHALGLFEPTEADEPVAQYGIGLRERELKAQWESAVVPGLQAGGLSVADNVLPVYGGRVGRHPAALTELLDGMQLVYNIDPTAKW
ncbi:MAG: 1,2-phenylacetyl-CoA epoxidase subunit PaaC [Planctomycetota bacterium]